MVFSRKAMKHRHVQNSVMRTLNKDGMEATSLSKMKGQVLGHFTTLYNSEARLRPRIECDFSARKLPELNTWLHVYPREEEVKFTLLTMPCEKAPEPDGLTFEIL